LCLLHLISNHPDMIDELAHIEYSHHRWY
jgi:hypothetical protein